jgi:spore cortex formation protein SpoVR/YcgB (stage V sporulation)
VTDRPLLYNGADWDFPILQRSYDAIERIAVEELGLDVYPNRIEIITAEQMLDVYTAHGMPLTYRHWSYGKRFLQHEGSYRRGYSSLAYEVVINSNPCISYLMEENSATMQALVIAHAAFGHNHFFRNNHLFRQWTEASAILDYLEFARSYIASCEDQHGVAAVERVLDAAHALSRHGVPRPGGAPVRSTSSSIRSASASGGTMTSRSSTISGALCPRARQNTPPTRRSSVGAVSACPRKICSILSRRWRPNYNPGSAR